MGSSILKKPSAYFIALLFILLGTQSCEFQKKPGYISPTDRYRVPASGGGPPPSPPPPTPEPEPEVFPPFVYLLPESWHSSFGKDVNKVARALLARSDISDAVSVDPAVFPLMISFFLDASGLPAINVFAHVYLQSAIALKRYSSVLYVDNGCRLILKLAEMGIIDLYTATDFFAPCASAFPVYPHVYFPWNSSIRNAPIYFAVGADPLAQDNVDLSQIVSDVDPFRSVDSRLMSGVIEGESVNPTEYSSSVMTALLNAYLRFYKMPQNESCRRAVTQHPNFGLFRIHTVQFRRDIQTLTPPIPPYSPALCREEIDYNRIGKNRLRNGCQDPRENCGPGGHVGRCTTPEHRNYSEVADRNGRPLTTSGAGSDMVPYTALVPALVVKAFQGKYSNIHFITGLDALPISACGVMRGSFEDDYR